VFASAPHVLHRLHQLIGAPHLGGDDAARRAVGHGASVPTGTRPDEETDLDPSLRGDLPHLIQLIVSQQHDAATLTDPVHGYLQLIGALEDGAQRVWPLDRWDLDPPLPTIRESLRGAGQIVQISRRQSHTLQESPRSLDSATFHRAPPPG
jgi:hypothetical protein